MKHNANSVDILAPATGLLFEAIVAATNFMSRHPGAVGGATAFAVCFLFVSANAAWYQPFRHPAPFFRTQAVETVPVDADARAVDMRIQRDDDVSTVNPEVKFVQRALTDLSLYTGSIDGVSGPRTREAVVAFRTKAGLDPEGGIDGTLLKRLKYGSVPVPTPAPRQSATREPDESVAEVQGLLVAAGYKGIDIDGLMGGRTSAAIRDFQRRNGLPENGEMGASLIRALRKSASKG
jgi:peptidoglycan hydrolase-like protein with peptidoglycan-binding domain